MPAPPQKAASAPERTASTATSFVAIGAVVATIGAALFVGLFHEVLFADRQLLHRDGAHFYWPYFKLIAAEWGAGHVPLWNPFENGGMPLAANPTASVFYPAKLLFLLPYGLAYKSYLLLHLLLAGFTAHRAARGFGAGPWGAGFASLAYAGSGYVLFQLYNVVYLCGAAWLPLGLLAAYRLVHRGSSRAALGLAVVLAMQVLAGDAETAYLTGIFTAVYALVEHGGRVCANRLRVALLLVGALAIGHGIVARTGLAWTLAIAGVVAIVWALRGRVVDPPARRGAWLLASAGALAAALAAIQVLPTAELVHIALRDLSTTPAVIANFSYFPANLLELLLPAIFGTHDPVYSRWAPWALLEGDRWVPSLYMGLSTIVAASCALRFRNGVPGARLLSWILVVSLLLAFGRFGGLAWLLRGVGDADGPAGLYLLAMQVMPGFDAFRYPAKLLAWTVLALALLAALGFDALLDPTRRRLLAAVAAFTAGTAFAFGVMVAFGDRLQSFVALDGPGSFITGPFDVSAAWTSLRGSVLHGACFGALLLGILVACRWRLSMRPAVLPTLLLLILALDLGLAGWRWVLTDDAAVWEAPPAVLETIAAAEREAGRDEPFRIFRPMNYYPMGWQESSDPKRRREFYRWERRTLRPKLGIASGLAHAVAPGTIDMTDTALFFEPWSRAVPAELRARLPDQPDTMYYYPRASFNLWNVRYFLVPFRQNLGSRSRSMLTLLGSPDGRFSDVLAQSGEDEDDFILLRNEEALPRAWAVHRLDVRSPLTERTVDARIERIRDLVHRDRDMGVRFWPGSSRTPFPLRERAMVETEHGETLAAFDNGPRASADSVRIREYESGRVTLDVDLETAGVVVLADTFYPGWEATVDGTFTPILRANRAMRGVPVAAGRHEIVMRYRPRTVAIGAIISALAWLLVAGAAVRMRSSDLARARSSKGETTA